MKKNFASSRIFFAVAAPLLAALFLAALPCKAQIPQQRENRFLFVVDTAYAMRGCSNAVVQDVVELLESDMRGEFREGDTIGLWTYNDKLHTEFPMQVWSKTNKNTMVANMATFLQERRCEKQAHLEKVMPTLNQVIKNSARITIVLIFDGTGLIQGTPFDKDINDLQKKYARELRLAHAPFITVLAARDGAIFDYTINYPGLVAIPHTANPEKPVATNAPVVAIAVPVPKAPAKPPRMASIFMSHSTNVVPAAAPAPVVAAAPPTLPTPPLAVAPVPAKPAPVVITPAPPPVAIVAPVTPAPVSQPAIAATAPPQSQPVPPPIVARQNPPPVADAPAPLPPPQTSVTPDGIQNAARPPNVIDAQQPTPVAPIAQNAAVANISPAAGTSLSLFVMAFSLLTIAVVLVVFLVRRSRSAPQPSLITQSIDRQR